MKISYNWLKEYISSNGKPLDLSAEETGKLLTNCGLEIEHIEKEESSGDKFNGVVVGEVKTCEKHPNADKLSVTTVDIGQKDLLHIVCGAPNVAAGQKVLVATIGATLYPTNGEPFKIKKSKIRGELSEGMLCAEDELGLGSSHDGIIVLDNNAKTGTSAIKFLAQSEQKDEVFEIGLTPNRADAACHVGVARDLITVLNCKQVVEKAEEKTDYTLALPNVAAFKKDNDNLKIEVVVEDEIACPRYSGLTMTNVTVKESPEWLQKKLKAIGVRPINNIVDVTNYVLHELGQPMHAFDAAKVKGNKVVVKKLKDNTKFITLDEKERALSSEDLMICNEQEPMCIAGVFGGVASGVTEKTTSIFLESAYFNSTSVRKSAKRHDLKTDASFRFERGTDPNMTVLALQRAALLIKEVAGGEISSAIVDVYPKKIENHKVSFSFSHCDQLIGKHIDHKLIKAILHDLNISIEQEGNDALLLSVPPFKVDVLREQDVIEEILRIYGYNNIIIPKELHASVQYMEKPDKEKIQNIISDLLSSNGFSEIMSLSLSKSDYGKLSKNSDENTAVKLMNPLSSDLNVMRQTLLFSGLETIAYNQNRKSADLRLYEFGKTYLAVKDNKYIEDKHLALFISGRKENESWNSINDNVNFYTIKGIVNAVLERLNISGNLTTVDNENDLLAYGICYKNKKGRLVELGAVSKNALKELDVKQEVFYADFNWDLVIELMKDNNIMYKEVPKFPEVRRDLALLLDNSVKYEQLEQLAYQAEKAFLKNVNLFDVYEGDKLPAGKKSYALSFTLLDEQATLTDAQIDKIMDKLMKTYKDKAGAEIR